MQCGCIRAYVRLMHAYPPSWWAPLLALARTCVRNNRLRLKVVSLDELSAHAVPFFPTSVDTIRSWTSEQMIALFATSAMVLPCQSGETIGFPWTSGVAGGCLRPNTLHPTDCTEVVLHGTRMTELKTVWSLRNGGTCFDDTVCTSLFKFTQLKNYKYTRLRWTRERHKTMRTKVNLKRGDIS